MNADDILSVDIAPGPPSFIKPQIYRGRRRQGIKYEKFVQQHLTDRFGPDHIPSPWLHYKLRSRWGDHYAQPDSLGILPGDHILIVEVKYQHTRDAYYQLFDLYEPLIRALFPAHRTTCIEVCKWYDPGVQCPIQAVLCPDLVEARTSKFNVHIYNP